MAKRALTVLVTVAGVIAYGCGGDSSGPGVPPVLTAISPVTGGVGTEVRISGSDIASGAAVYFGSLQSPRAELQGGELFALAPDGLTAGTTYDIRVVNPDGGEDVLSAAFQAVGPSLLRVNGVTKPTGLIGMTVILDGAAFGDSLALANGKVYFADASGLAIEAAVADSANDWTNDFVVTSVPSGTADTSWVWVETATGVSDSVEFRVTAEGSFSPSDINWTTTTPLPQPLQGLGAVFVPIEDGPSPANYVFTVGGADTMNVATSVVYRATVQQNGELGASWDAVADLPDERAYLAVTAATAFTAALDTTTTGAILYAIGGVDSTAAPVNTVFSAEVDLQGAVGAWVEETSLPAPLHAASAAVFRGFLYVVGGAGADSAAVADVWRIAVADDGSLGSSWEALPSLPTPASFAAVTSFGPFLHVIGGETGTTAPVSASQTGTETGAVYFARINLRDGRLTSAGWTATEAMGKQRSKHSSIFSGGSLFTTSGLYAGLAGSSENTFANVLSDGTLEPWQGATGADIIDNALGYSIYNQAAVTFIDVDGIGHVLVLGGAREDMEGVPSAGVVYY